MSKDDFVVEMLTLQFISGKTAGSAAEYVELYVEAKRGIEKAYNASVIPEAAVENQFNIDPLL